MARDDADVDSTDDSTAGEQNSTTGEADSTARDAGSTGAVPEPDDHVRPPATDAEPRVGELPSRLSETVPSRRSYGKERITAAEESTGLLSARERQYLRHAHRMDPPDRDAVENVLTERVEEFVDADWPVIREEYPDVAEELRAALCGGESD